MEKADVPFGYRPGILAGVRALDLATLISGPYCASLLGDLGAEVIKVEPPGWEDGLRHLGTQLKGEGVLFLGVNRNKRGMTLDLDKDGAREVLDRLLATADVVVENFRPDIRDRYGVDPDRVRRLRPSMVYLSITAFGEEGPYRLKPGTDHLFQAMSGLMTVSGEEATAPLRVGLPVADLTAALYGALGVVGALLKRMRTGAGSVVRVNLLDAAMCLQATHLTEFFLTGAQPPRCGNDSPFAYPVGIFKTAGGYLALSAFNDKFWRGLCRTLGLDGLIWDPRFVNPEGRLANREALRKLLEERFRRAPTPHWIAALEAEDVPCGPVYDYKALLGDPQVRVNALDREVEHGSLGRIRIVGNPLRFNGLTPVPLCAAPLLGRDTEAVLGELGYDPAALGRLRDQGII